MSVLSKTIDSDHLDVYCKGAPEKIYELCKPETSNFFLFFFKFNNYKYLISKISTN